MARAIQNTTRNTRIAGSVKMADNFFLRLKGLMLGPGLPADHGLWIVPCNNIHSCFMLVDFDAIFVNKQLQVVHVEKAMKPWRISKIVFGGHAVLELPAGVVERSGTDVGDQLAWTDLPDMRKS